MTLPRREPKPPTVRCHECGQTVQAREDGTPVTHSIAVTVAGKPKFRWCEGGELK